jgi:hypothetical protein
VAVSTAYKWMRDMASVRASRSRPSGRPHAGPSFARVLSSREAAAAIAVRVGAAEIQIRHGFEADLLLAVVEALGGGGA